MNDLSPALLEELAKAVWVTQQQDAEWAERVVDDVFSPADDWPTEAINAAEIATGLFTPILSRALTEASQGGKREAWDQGLTYGFTTLNQRLRIARRANPYLTEKEQSQ